MKSSELFPHNPVVLAALRAEEAAIANHGEFEISDQDEWRITELDHAANSLGFLGSKYFVESRRSVSVPVAWEDADNVTRIDFKGLTFEGSFVTYSQVVIGKILGAHSVRALCMSFDEVTLLPYFDKLPEDHLLYVPVLAVESISNQAA